MNLQSPHRPRERILTFGVSGTGKSNAIATLAKHSPQSTFYVLDNDMGSWERLLTDPELEMLHPDNGGNVVIYEVDNDDFEGHSEIIQKISVDVNPDDWAVVDMYTPTWGAVQSWFTDQVFDQSIEDYFIEVRKMRSTGKQRKADGERGDDKTLGAFEGFTDWPVINKVYTGKWVNPVMRLRCHLYCTAEQDKIQEGGKGKQGDDKDIKALFGSYGVKPKGQKRTPHLFHTILLMTKSRVGEYRFTTIKDRARPEVQEQDFSHRPFAMEYFFKIAGWRPVS